MKGVNLEFGSIKEMLAIEAFNRERDITINAAILPAVNKDGLAKMYESLNMSIFPEMRLQNILKLKSYEKAFEDLKGEEFIIIKS